MHALDNSRHDGIRFNLDQPIGIDRLHDLDHGRGGTDGLEEFTMRLGRLLPSGHLLEVNPGANHVFEFAAGVLDRFLNDFDTVWFGRKGRQATPLRRPAQSGQYRISQYAVRRAPRVRSR